MPTTLTRHIGEQLRREQLVAVVGEEGIHRPIRDQMTTPGRRVQLVIGWVARGRHAGQSARPPAHRAHYRIDTANTINPTTPIQQPAN